MTTYGMHSLSQLRPSDSLPADVRLCKSVTTFKQYLKTRFVAHQLVCSVHCRQCPCIFIRHYTDFHYC